MSRVISIDFETFYATKDGHGIKEQGMSGYVRDPRFDAYMVSVSDGSEHWAGHPKDLNWDALDGAVWLSHNAAFDSRVYDELVARGRVPKVRQAAWHCTANLTTFLCMRRDLARACEFLLGVKVDKTERGKADGKQWTDFSPADREAMLNYARLDAVHCWTLWAKYAHLWPDMERRLSELTIRQGRRGVQIDEKKLLQFLGVAERMRIGAEHDLPWMKEGKKPTSPKAIAEECHKVGIPCPPVKSRDGEEAYDAWAAEHGGRHAWVKAFTDYRVINKFIDILTTIKGRLDNAGVFPFDMLYFGAHTGRWSGSGGFNVQNMRKEPLYCDVEGRLVTDDRMLKEISKSLEAEKKLPGFVAHALDLRSLFIPRAGRKMIVCDLSQIEPRVLAWCVGDKSMLQLMAGGQSPYEAHARATMNWTGGNMKKEAKELYALAKARVLGLGYGCGWEKFITVAYMMAGLDITKDDPEFVQAVNAEGNPCFKPDGTPQLVSGYGHNSKRIVEEYRSSNPLVASRDPEHPGIWKQLDDAFRASAGGDFTMELPSGRTLRYPEVREEWKAVPDPENPKRYKKKRVFTALAFNQRVNNVVREAFYGGLLTENLVQAIARDVFGYHLLRLDETSGIDPLWGVHDESVNEVDQHVTKEDVRNVMRECPPWIPGLPIDAEAIETPHYLK